MAEYIKRTAVFEQFDNLLEVDVGWCGSGYAYYLQMRSL